MYSTLFGALLMGMFPALGGINSDTVTVASVAIAPPANQVKIEDHVSASGIVVMDLYSGQTVFARQENVSRPMASLTKLMTALIIVENHDLDEPVRVPGDISNTPGNVAYLPPGHTFSVGDLLSALLVTSANDAAATLARFHSGSSSAFVAEMNTRAKSLGMKATSFRNPEGLDNPAHWSTPQDFAWLTMHVMKRPEIAARMGKRNVQIVSSQGEKISLAHTHALLHQEEVIVAGKTGTTSDAGQCLISVIEEGAKEYVIVLLHSNQRYQDLNVIIKTLGMTLENDTESKTASVATLRRS